MSDEQHERARHADPCSGQPRNPCQPVWRPLRVAAVAQPELVAGRSTLLSPRHVARTVCQAGSAAGAQGPGRPQLRAQPWCTDLVRSHVSPATGCLPRLGVVFQPELCRLRWCTAEAACCLPAAKSGSDIRDWSFLFLLSVGRIFLHPIGASAFGRLDRPPMASQLVHSFETIRTMFGRLRRPSRRRSSTVISPSRAASRIAF